MSTYCVVAYVFKHIEILFFHDIRHALYKICYFFLLLKVKSAQVGNIPHRHIHLVRYLSQRHIHSLLVQNKPESLLQEIIKSNNFILV